MDTINLVAFVYSAHQRSLLSSHTISQPLLKSVTRKKNAVLGTVYFTSTTVGSNAHSNGEDYPSHLIDAFHFKRIDNLRKIKKKYLRVVCRWSQDNLYHGKRMPSRILGECQVKYCLFCPEHWRMFSFSYNSPVSRAKSYYT